MNQFLAAFKKRVSGSKKHIKKAFGIYQADVRKITGSWVTLVVMLGIIVLPSLYAWLNIYASWDPYGNTGRMKVAVISEDKGASIANVSFNAGDEIISNMKENDKLGWVFCDNEDDCIHMVEDGSVYAAIIIPKDFSLSLTSFLTDSPQKPDIAYYINEKKNAIAPKILGSATTTLKTEISSSILKTAAEKVDEKLNSLGIDLQNNENLDQFLDQLDALDTNFPKLPQKLDHISNQLGNGIVALDTSSQDFQFIKQSIDDLNTFNNGISSAVQDSNADIQNLKPDLRSNLDSAGTLLTDLSNEAGSLSSEISEKKSVTLSDLNTMSSDLKQFQTDMKKAQSDLSKFNSDDLDDLKDLCGSTLKDTDNLKALLSDASSSTGDINKLETVLSETQNLCGNISSNLRHLQNGLDNLYTDNDRILQNLGDFCAQLEKIISKSEAGSNSAELTPLISNAESDLNTLNGSLSQDKAFFSKAIAAMSGIRSDLQRLSAYSGDSGALSGLSSNVQALSEFITTLRTSLKTFHTNMDDNLGDAETLCDAISSFSSSLRSDLARVGADLDSCIDNMENTVSKLQSVLTDSTDALDNLQNTGNDTILPNMGRISDAAGRLHNQVDSLEEYLEKDQAASNLKDVQNTAFDTQTLVSTLKNDLDDQNFAALADNVANGTAVLTDANKNLSDLKKITGDLNDFVSDAADDGKVALSKFNTIKKEIPSVTNALSKIQDQVSQVRKNVSFNDLINFLKKDRTSQSEYISSPVDLTTHRVYPSDNYGQGLSPFYSALALWVGCLFLAALLTTKSLNSKAVLTIKEVYWGKCFLFLTIAALQGLVTALGDLVLLRISVHNPFLFVLLSVFFSLMFSLIMYSLTATLNTIGKALAVIILLFQVNGSGGTFPIEVTPSFFRFVYHFLPLTYAIDGFREAIYGVSFDALMKDIGILLLFGALFTAYGVICKKPITRLFQKYSDKLNESNVLH